MVALRDTSRVGDALQSLAGALESLELGPELADLEIERHRLDSIIRSYLIPRALDPTIPLTVVFAGPTGSGKSTLLNSLTGRDLAATGALRPTTTRPLVLASATAAESFERVADIECRVVAGEAPVLSAMALVDTPDIDSAAVEHRAMAEALIDNADVVVFVTSALRYADDVPWQVLRRAVARGTQVINVLNRVGSATSGATIDFKARLRSAGLEGDLVTVPEHHLPAGGSRIPSTAIRSLAKRLAAIVADQQRGSRETFDRVLRAVSRQVTDLIREVEALIDETDSTEAELSIYLADRAASVYMGGLVDGLYVPPPEKDTLWSRRRWRAVNRPDPDQVAAGETTIIDRFMAIVDGDLRRWIVDERTLAGSPGEIIPQVRPIIRSAAEGWIRYVARIGEEIGTPEPWLTRVALMDAATDAEHSVAAHALLGEHAPVLIDRARRELRGRLEVVYDHVGGHVLDRARDGMGPLDVSDVRSALGAVNSTLAPVDA
ncbi:MAG: 50S ribosome-binding GTPase [Acidimicrobiia bacterium]